MPKTKYRRAITIGCRSFLLKTLYIRAMKWKDWLHIPQSDKIAIVALSVLIIVAFIIYIIISNQPKEKFDLSEPKDYTKWKSQLIENQEEEKEFYAKESKKYNKLYQPKMKIGESIELNSADTTQLKMIPGIGSGFANRIVNHRTALRGFIKMEQLEEVWGMDTYLYSQIVPYLTLKPHNDSIYINRESFEALLKHPYLNYKQVMVIDDIRTRKGAIRSLNRLALLDEFKKKDITRLKDYVSFKE